MKPWRFDFMPASQAIHLLKEWCATVDFTPEQWDAWGPNEREQFMRDARAMRAGRIDTCWVCGSVRPTLPTITPGVRICRDCDAKIKRRPIPPDLRMWPDEPAAQARGDQPLVADAAKSGKMPVA